MQPKYNNSDLVVEIISEYDQNMIKMYSNKIYSGVLIIKNSKKLNGLDFLYNLDIKRLELLNFKIIPKLHSQTITQISIFNSFIQNFEEIQIDNLETLGIYNHQNLKQTQPLKLKINQFTKLKILCIQGWAVDLQPLSQITWLTTLILEWCKLDDANSLRPLINLVDLSINYNKSIDISSVQHLTQLSKLSLMQCGLINVDILCPLQNLRQLNISWNSIVYIQPLMKLNNLSSLDATNNKILDMHIERHPNFAKFNFENQLQPTKKQVNVANIMKNINSPTSSLKYISVLSIHFTCKYTIFRQHIIKYLQSYICTHNEFLVQTSILFQQVLEDHICQ
ncbi:leucine-rich_repeat domain-containing protein [Hexamita inflata]|uniref:Leucine-rich_repeat domain-containing protein n=1 Tax=Hexamita inflata TaxID=28002 RepID=A0ABP1KJ89_9EUKA